MAYVHTTKRSTMAAFIGLVVVTALLGLPFFWMVLSALKPAGEVLFYPPRWWPSEIRWANFSDAWHAAPFGTFYWNSILTSTATTFATVLFSLFMAYAFVFIPFPGKRFLFAAIIATMLIPDEMKLIPNYLLLSRLGWIDTYWALIVPPIANAFPVFVFATQFRLVPRDLIDVAQIDGASHSRTLLTIITPLSRPVVVAIALVTFLGRWNDYLWPLVVTDSQAMRVLPVGLAYLREAGEGTTPWNLLMAATIFVIIPILVLYVLAQRHFVDGLTRGALKG